MTVSRPIGPADMEHYYGGIVRQIALELSGYTDAEFNAASYRIRKRWLDRAVRFACAVFNTPHVAQALPAFAKNMQERANVPV